MQRGSRNHMRHAEETLDSKKACAVRNREAGLDRASLGSGYRAYLKSTGSQGTVSSKGRGACAGTYTWAIR